MPLDQLLAALERDAHTAAARVLADARAEAERIAAVAEREIGAGRDASAGALTRERHAELDRELSAVALGARRDVLVARTQLLSRVFAAMRAELPAVLERPAYLASLPARIAAARSWLDDPGPVVLRCPSSLLKAVRSAITGDGAITVEEMAAAGNGMRLTTADRVIEVDDTLESRLEAERHTLERAALARLGLLP